MNKRALTAETDASRLQIGDFQLDLRQGELLTREGDLAPLRRQSLEALLVLGRRAGQVIGKEELMTSVWPHTVVGEGSLTQAVADIRKVLGDREHRLIRNVARRGYMLVPGQTDLSPRSEVEPDRPSDPGITRELRQTSQQVEGTVAVWRYVPLMAWVVVAMVLSGGVWFALSNPVTQWRTPQGDVRSPLPEQVPAFSVAVLPVVVEGDAGDMDWLATALHADLITELAQVPASTVIARDTMAIYAGKSIDPRQLARELGVRYVVRGSLRREADFIRLNFVLVDGDNGVQRWGQTYLAKHATLSQTLGDFVMQLERALQVQLVFASVARRMALSPEQVSADELAMRGMALWYRGFNKDNLTAALPLLNRAVQMDPDSARAWNGIAVMNLHGMLNGWGIDRTTALRRIAQAGAQLERIDRDGNATYQAKTIPLYLKGDSIAMLRHTQAWVDRHRSAIGFGAHGMALLINGRFDEAAQAEERALSLSPLDTFRAEWQYRLAMAHFASGRHELARDWGQTAATTNPALRWPPVHAAALQRLGQTEAARSIVAEYLSRFSPVSAASLKVRLPGDDPRLAKARDDLMTALQKAGMP